MQRLYAQLRGALRAHGFDHASRRQRINESSCALGRRDAFVENQDFGREAVHDVAHKAVFRRFAWHYPRHIDKRVG